MCSYQALSISALWISGIGIISDTFDGVWACEQLCLYRLTNSLRNTSSSGAVKKGIPKIIWIKNYYIINCYYNYNITIIILQYKCSLTILFYFLILWNAHILFKNYIFKLK